MNQRLKEERIGTLLWKFSLPAIVAMLVNALYNIVDRIFVGQGVGSIGIAAITVAFPIMIVNMAVSMLIGVGATSLISIHLGEQKKQEAERVAANAISIKIILSVILTVLYLLFQDPILMFFGADAQVLPYARDFTCIIMLGSVFGTISMGVNNFIRAEGNPQVAMMTQITGTLINIVLNYIFIFKLGLGIRGSALATICGQAVSAIWVMTYFLGGYSFIRIKAKNLKPRLSTIWKIVAIGFGPFAMQLAMSAQHTILNSSVMKLGGDLALAAVGIMMSVGTLIIMPIIGFNQGAQPLIGYNYGAREYVRVKKTLKLAVMAASCYAVAVFLVISIWPTQIVGLFSKGDTDLTMLTTHAMHVFFTLIPLAGFQILCSGYFQAVGKPVKSMILSLSRQVLFFIPMLLILPHIWGLEGVWRSAPVADALSVALTAVLITIEMRKLGQEQLAVDSAK
jgi:putative MATE family efflux protein